MNKSMEKSDKTSDFNGNQLNPNLLNPNHHSGYFLGPSNCDSSFIGNSSLSRFARSLSLVTSDNRSRSGLDHRGSLPVSSIVPPSLNEVPVDSDLQFSQPMDIDGRSKYNKTHNLYDDYSLGAREAHINLAYEMDRDKSDDFDPKFIALKPTYNGDSIKSECPEARLFEDGDPVNYIARKTLTLAKSNFAIIKFIAFLLYNLYIFIAIRVTWNESKSCCDGIKFLVIITGIIYAIAVYYLAVKKIIFRPIYKKFIRPFLQSIESRPTLHGYIRLAVFSTIIILFVIYTAYLSKTNSKKIISACGIFIFIGISYLLSVNRPAIQWSQVIWGITFQFLMANIVLKTDIGKSIFQCVGNKIVSFLDFTNKGSEFVFGALGSSTNPAGIFAFKVLPIIIFFSFTVSVLYHYGVMQIAVIKLGWFLQVTIGSTACESLAAAGNIFLGMTETPLMIKPYLQLMTQSELFAILTEGFSTIAGSVLAAYINFGINASYLLSASVMAAPASIGIAKLVFPETHKSLTRAEDIQIEKTTERNALEAGANGASQAVKLCANIAANLIALLAFVSFLDSLVSWFASLVGAGYINFRWLLSRLFIPLAWVMGVEWQDTEKVARLLGTKTFLNEFVAYTELAELKNNNQLSERSQVIATFALCGFSNICAIGIQMGGVGSLIPHRRSELASMAVRAMIAGSIVTFISASMAGLLYTETNINYIDVNITSTTPPS